MLILRFMFSFLCLKKFTKEKSYRSIKDEKASLFSCDIKLGEYARFSKNQLLLQGILGPEGG